MRPQDHPHGKFTLTYCTEVLERGRLLMSRGRIDEPGVLGRWTCVADGSGLFGLISERKVFVVLCGIWSRRDGRV